MNKLPKISDAEWEVMEIIWSHSPISGNEVAQRLADRQDWHLRTIKTMLSRLTRKGVLSYKKEKNTFKYSAVIERNCYIHHISQNVVQRLFKGDHSLALTHFVESTELSHKDIEDLNALLKQKSDET